jgi:uncharacterized protein (DUF302 family)
MSFTLKKPLALSYDEAITRVPEALKSEGFGVLTEIDIRQTLKNKLGVDFRRYKIRRRRPCCHPRHRPDADPRRR